MNTELKISLGYDRESTDSIDVFGKYSQHNTSKFSDQLTKAMLLGAYNTAFLAKFCVFSTNTSVIFNLHYLLYIYVWYTHVPVDAKVHAGTQVFRGVWICACMNVKTRYLS